MATEAVNPSEIRDLRSKGGGLACLLTALYILDTVRLQISIYTTCLPVEILVRIETIKTTARS